MSKSVLLDARLFTAGIDLSGNSNKIQLTSQREDKDVTNYRSAGWTERLAGLGSAQLAGGGQWESSTAAPVDANLFANLAANQPWTMCPSDAIVGAVCYVMAGIETKYTLLGQVGDVNEWAATAMSTAAVGRGQIVHPPGTARTTTGTGTACQVGAIPTAKQMIATLHVLSVSGTTPSITVAVQSDDNSGFTSAVTQATFTAANAVGGQTVAITGPITDDYWRASWTITGTTPSFLFVVGLGLT